MRTPLTLCLIYNNGNVLLGMKKRGFGTGRWNGFGGKVEAGETVQEAAVREMQEECGITPTSLDRVGTLDFTFDGKEGVLEVHVFSVTSWEGEPAETEEMRPQWFPIDSIPFDEMWPDDRHWFPLYLAGKRFTGAFAFDGDGKIREMSLTETDRIRV